MRPLRLMNSRLVRFFSFLTFERTNRLTPTLCATDQKADYHRRSLLHRPSYYHEIQATLASSPEKPVGYSLWHSPVDRTETEGGLLPEEKEAEKAQEEYLKATATEADKELDRWTDMEFVKLFKNALWEKRKDYFRGEKHWYLVRFR